MKFLFQLTVVTIALMWGLWFTGYDKPAYKITETVWHSAVGAYEKATKPAPPPPANPFDKIGRVISGLFGRN